MYTVTAPSGIVMMHSESDFRYPPDIELQMISAGFVIRLNGKKLTKKEVSMCREPSLHSTNPSSRR